MKKCKNCGELVADNVDFCPECGSMEFESTMSSSNPEPPIDEVSPLPEEGSLQGTTATDNNINTNFSSKKLKLTLIDENENEIKSWTLGKLPSYSLGRISSKGSVDIDFSDFEVGQYVSRRHGKIYKKGDRWYYSDLGSKHGSELISNSKRETLVPMEEYELKPGDILILAKKVRLEIS